MKTIIETDKVKKDINAKLYSDLHYNPEDDLSFLKRSTEKMEKDQPEYVFFLGDLIDDSKYTITELKKLFELLNRMAKLSNVILVLGNHDQFTKNDTGEWEEKYNLDFVNELKNTGITVLQNESYQDENLFVYGTQFPGMYYEEREPVKEFLANIKNADFSESNQFNVLLEHSPKYTFDSEYMSLLTNLDDVDLTLAGHYHNGCVPWYISKCISGNKGLIDPYMNTFPEYARGEKQITENNYGIISAPLRTFSSKSPLFSAINKVFYPSVEQDILIKKR